MSRYRAWAYQSEKKQNALIPGWQSELPGIVSSSSVPLLPFGNGRSYGDSCLNQNGQLVDTQRLDFIHSFNTENGVLIAGPGCSLDSILPVIVPAGWFLPVTPGTSFVSLGGALANDVHGKNHHADGTFGRFVIGFTLLRSDGEEIWCSASENVEFFRATIGGMGLTGIITQIHLQLISINSSFMDVRIDQFQGLDEFAQLSARYKADSRYTVAWIDCATEGRNFARGVFFSANHAESGELVEAEKKNPVSVPFSFPSWVLNQYSIRTFNTLYNWRHNSVNQSTISQYYRKYFYPLDSIGNWNRIYGRNGFYQYQFVLPHESLNDMDLILRKIVDSGMGSFLAVLKEFGDVGSPGLLSFPRPGYCLALDFSNRGNRTAKLIHELDTQVRACGGAAYPAKDRLMTAESFRQYFPNLDEFNKYIDSAFSSDFWRRVSG